MKKKNYFHKLHFLLLIFLFFIAHCSATTLFYPIGIYAVPDTNDFPLLHQTGFNIVVGPAEKSYLDAAKKFDLKVLASPGSHAGQSFQPDLAKKNVRRFDSHSALWAWYLSDEPDLNLVPPDDVAEANRIVKKAGAKKPTALVISKGNEALHYANIAGITMIDRYPVPWLPLANFPQHLEMTRLALGKNKPMLAVIQAFDWNNYRSVLGGQSGLRPPTFAEIRCMTYCALATGANGLFYYGFESGHWKIKEHPETWDALARVVNEIKEREPLFKAEHFWQPYQHKFGDGYNGFNEALNSSVCPAWLRVKSGNEEIPRGTYLLAVNNTTNYFDYKITLPLYTACSDTSDARTSGGRSTTKLVDRSFWSL